MEQPGRGRQQQLVRPRLSRQLHLQATRQWLVQQCPSRQVQSQVTKREQQQQQQHNTDRVHGRQQHLHRQQQSQVIRWQQSAMGRQQLLQGCPSR
jgi:hypothetical protein